MVELRDESKEKKNEKFYAEESQAEIAEGFFYNSFETTMKVREKSFDFISRRHTRKRNNVEAEYDTMLFNDNEILILDIHYKYKNDYVREFYEDKLKTFRAFFPQYSQYKIYGAVAAFAFEKDVKKEAERYGFYIFTQSNEKFKIANHKDFEPNEVK